MSEVVWVLVSDILLTFLEKVQGTEDVAYVNDILNFLTELFGVQEKADWISAVCAFIGLEIACKKKTSFCEDGNPTLPNPEPPPQMQVRRWDWFIHAVDFTDPL
jgi:hypothetical protein